MLIDPAKFRFIPAVVVLLLTAIVIPASVAKKKKKSLRVPKVFYGNWKEKGATSCPGGLIDQTFRTRSRFRRFRKTGLKIKTRFESRTWKLNPNGKFRNLYTGQIYRGACGPNAPSDAGLFLAKGRWKIRGKNIVARGTQTVFFTNGGIAGTRTLTSKWNRKGPRLAVRSFASDGFALRSISRRGRGKSIGETESRSKAKTADRIENLTLFPHYHLPPENG